MNLESLGYRVIEARNGVEAKEIIATTSEIKLVFNDVVMPCGVSGYDLAKWVQAEKPGLKVLLASGHNDVTVDEALRLSVRLLNKPYKRSQLAYALRELSMADA
jgi:YesN/AraC family two-component response regulator